MLPFSAIRRAPSPARGKRRLARGALAAAAVVIAGCYIGNQGEDPPLNRLYFPTGLVTSPGRTALYITNSDFDLQFNGGTVMAFKLGLMRDVILKPLLKDLVAGLGTAACTNLKLPPNFDQVGGALEPNPGGAGSTETDSGFALLYPGPCNAVDSTQLIGPVATIGAFASGATLALRTDGKPGARLFVPVRGDPSATWFDVPDDRGFDPKTQTPTFALNCDGTGAPLNRCSDTHKAGVNPSDSVRGLTMPTEPVGVAASQDGTAIVVANQTTGVASLVWNTWGGIARLQHFLPGLAPGPTDLAAVPIPKLFQQLLAADKNPACPSFTYDPGFLLTFRGGAELDLLRAHSDSCSTGRAYLTRAYAIGISTNAPGDDSRGVAIDDSQRRACEDACAAGDGACLVACLDTPLRVFVASRSPPSLLVGEVTTTLTFDGPPNTDGSGATSAIDSMGIFDQVPLAAGPSRVVMGDVIGMDGKLHKRVFVVAFDSRLVFDYDPDARVVEATIKTGRGPHSLALDTGDDGDGLHSYLYVAHFTDSYLGVVDLDQRHGNTFGTMFATIGSPLSPRESK